MGHGERRAAPGELQVPWPGDGGAQRLDPQHSSLPPAHSWAGPGWSRAARWGAGRSPHPVPLSAPQPALCGPRQGPAAHPDLVLTLFLSTVWLKV